MIKINAERGATIQQARFERAVQSTLDALAMAAGYENVITAISYAEEPAIPKFQADGQAFRAWRSKCWDYCYEQLASVKSGVREQPTLEAFLAELPQLELPA